MKTFRIYWPVLLVFVIGYCWWLWPTWSNGIAKAHIPKNHKFTTEMDQQNLLMSWEGLRGDSFGALNVLIAGLGLVGVLITLNLQREASAHAEEAANSAKSSAEEEKAIQRNIADAMARTALLNAITARIHSYDTIISELTFQWNKNCQEKGNWKNETRTQIEDSLAQMKRARGQLYTELDKQLALAAA